MSGIELARLHRTEKRLSSLTLVLAVLSLVGVYVAGYLAVRRGQWLAAAGTGVVAITLAFTARHLDWRINRLADGAMRIKAREDERPPILVLRSFREGSLGFRPAKTGKNAIEPGSSYLNALAFAVRPLGQLIAIGAPQTVITEAFDRPAVLYFQSGDSSWPRMFDLASKAARLIIVIPGVTPSLLREVGALASSDRLSKVVLLMPPTPSGAIRWIAAYREPQQISVKWEHARTEWRRIGIELPAYQKSGMLFALHSDGTVEAQYTLNGFVEGLDLTPIRALAQRATGGSAPLRDLIAELGLLEVPVRRPPVSRQLIEFIFLGRL